jgi:hypothetical protein
MWRAYVPIDYEKLAKDNLIKELFFESCAPLVKDTMKKIDFCEGCREFWPCQLEHACMYPQAKTISQMELFLAALPYLQREPLAVVQKVKEAVRANGAKYTGITLYEFMNFLTPYKDMDPFAKICCCKDWQKIWPSS